MARHCNDDFLFHGVRPITVISPWNAMQPMSTTTDDRPSYTPGGYYLGNTNSNKKTKAIARLISRFGPGLKPVRILVVGCGDGNDAAALAGHFACPVNAIDIEDYFNPRNAAAVHFDRMDARNLQFPAASFGLVYSFHALEHIPHPDQALKEVRRVLRPGGLYCIGTPNRLRLLGYIGVPGYPLADKVRANLRDWRQRLIGRFRNELGAHAGFSSSELMALCATIGSAADISNEYYRELYAGQPRFISLIIKLRLRQIAWPSVYVFGARRPD